MWGTDMTQTVTIREGRANVFVAVEHANSEVVAFMHRGRLIASRPEIPCSREILSLLCDMEFPVRPRRGYRVSGKLGQF